MKKVMLLASKDMCDILKSALDNTYIMLPCSDPAAASVLLESRPDILILELSLPGANGMAFLNEHAKSLPSAILVLTTFVNRSILQNLSDQGVSSAFLVPCKISCLMDAIKEPPPASPGGV